MRTTVDLDELAVYRDCPERERRRKLDPQAGIAPIEKQYQDRMRGLLVRFYGELLSGNVPTEAELRRSWSRMWEIPAGMTTRTFNKANASFLNAILSNEERMLARGAAAINQFLARPMHQSIVPVMVDEPFSIQAGKILITGRFDLVFEDKRHNYWIVDWTSQPGRYDTRYDLKHAVLANSFEQKTGRKAGILIDYIRTLGDYIEPSKRTEDEQSKQVLEAVSIAEALAANIHYRRMGPHCQQCPFQASCIGVKVVQAKRPRGRPRTRPVPK